MADKIHIKILNWRKYNPRLDSKKPSWFRMDNSFATGPKLFEMNFAQKWFLVWLFSVASQHNKAELELTTGYMSNSSGVPEQDVLTALRILNDNGTVQASVPDSHGTRTTVARVSHESVRVSPATDGQTGRTDEQTDGPSQSSWPMTSEGQNLGDHPLVKIWNLNSGSLAKVKPIKKRTAASEKRLKTARIRWEEWDNEAFSSPEAYWTEIVKRIAKSPFCLGDNDRQWTATFEYLCRVETHGKVMSGEAAKPTSSRRMQHSESVAAAAQAQMARVERGEV